MRVKKRRRLPTAIRLEVQNLAMQTTPLWNTTRIFWAALDRVQGKRVASVGQLSDVES